jgi:hypothetical protein
LFDGVIASFGRPRVMDRDVLAFDVADQAFLHPDDLFNARKAVHEGRIP